MSENQRRKRCNFKYNLFLDEIQSLESIILSLSLSFLFLSSFSSFFFPGLSPSSKEGRKMEKKRKKEEREEKE